MLRINQNVWTPDGFGVVVTAEYMGQVEVKIDGSDQPRVYRVDQCNDVDDLDQSGRYDED